MAVCKASGDRAILAEFGSRIAPEIHREIRGFTMALEQEKIDGVTEWVPAYCSVTVHYRPEVIGYDALKARLEELLAKQSGVTLPPALVWEIPVFYGGDMGEDLAFVAEHSGLAAEEVIRRHTEPEYLVYMLGFTPGFPYLGGMDPAIAAPRLPSPRVKIPAGSVGIAGQQTGVYPVASPGGWQLIGRTPVKLYDPARETPVLLKAGDYVKFRAVEQEEFDAILQQEQQGTYRCRTWKKEG